MVVSGSILFKPKPAYAMRIGDWSQTWALPIYDVDAGLLLGLQHDARGIILGVFQHLAVEGPFDLRAVVVDGDRARIAFQHPEWLRHRSDDRRGEEIGRASCRERVWQYV